MRRRITVAAALAVAAVAIALGVTAYLQTRSHLIGELRQELYTRVAPLLGPHGNGDNNGSDGDGNGPFGVHGGGGNPGAGAPPGSQFGARPPSVPTRPANGGAAGTFQFVSPGGRVRLGQGSTLKLPVTAKVRQIATSGHGRFYMSATVDGQKLEILTIADPADHYAIQVAEPLKGVDDVLGGLLLPYGALIGGGIVLAGLLGAFIARSALRPIIRFTEQTEAVRLDKPRHLDGGSAVELSRLADSFNRTLDALERSIAAQRGLIADASHELRTPMAALRSNIQILLEADRLPPEDRVGLQDSILAELDELTQLVSDVLELARGSAAANHVEQIELDGLIHDAVARAARRAPAITFELDIDPTVITGPPDRIGRAVANVIDNARKWSPADGTIEVSLHGGVLTVRDHGPGFQTEDIPHVFDRFYRADAARRMPGSGLGLAIVKQAAETQGGLAEAANAPDGGAVIRVSFGHPG